MERMDRRINARAIGRVIKIIRLLSERIIVCLSDTSNIGPKIKPIINGRKDRSSLTIKYPITPYRPMTTTPKRSPVLK